MFLNVSKYHIVSHSIYNYNLSIQGNIDKYNEDILKVG